MPAIDTNVLLRYLVADDQPQRAAALELVRRHAAEGEPMFVPVTVLLETEWVLRTTFKLGKPMVSALLVRLIGSEPMTFDSAFAVAVALDLYQGGSADFADCLHLALSQHAGEIPLFTFDRKAARMPDVTLVEPARGPEPVAARPTDEPRGRSARVSLPPP